MCVFPSHFHWVSTGDGYGNGLKTDVLLENIGVRESARKKNKLRWRSILPRLTSYHARSTDFEEKIEGLNRLRRAASNFIGLILSHSIRKILAFFSGVEFFEDFNPSSEKEESRCLVFTSSTKREIRHFHVVVVQGRQRNVQKSVMHAQSYCFANLNQERIKGGSSFTLSCLNLLLLSRSRWRRRGSCLTSLMGTRKNKAREENTLPSRVSHARSFFPALIFPSACHRG